MTIARGMLHVPNLPKSDDCTGNVAWVPTLLKSDDCKRNVAWVPTQLKSDDCKRNVAWVPPQLKVTIARGMLPGSVRPSRHSHTRY